MTLTAQSAVDRAPSPDDSVDRDLLAIDAVIYADLFDCAVDRAALRRFSLVPCTETELGRTVDRLARDGVLAVEGDGVCLADRRELLDELLRRRRRADRLRRRSRALARMLSRVPFVRGLALTGSAAAGVCAAEADVDLLVLVAPDRLATAWLLLGGVAGLTGRRFFCPNYYLCERALAIDRRSHFVAREIVQAAPLSGLAHQLARQNPWAFDRFPNAMPAERPAPERVASRVQRFCEWVLTGRVGNWLERRARRLASRRLVRHYRYGRGEIPADVDQQWAKGEALRFHGARRMVGIMRRYERRRSEIRKRLVSALGVAGEAR